MSIRDHWKRKAQVRRKEVISLKPINFFNARDDEVETIGELLEVPRERSSIYKDGKIGVWLYRMRMVDKMLVRVGTHGMPGTSLQMNSVAVALGTYRGDPRVVPCDQTGFHTETDEGFRLRLQNIIVEWVAAHTGGDHKCEACCK